jgi:ornithine cyclodeaminase/alanine dehydrogenase-like protein (mu-crystallin family)
MSIRIIAAEEIRKAVRFDEIIEAVSTALQESSAGLAENGLIVMLPAARPDLGDVYVKTGVLRGHGVYIVKVSPWFKANVERNRSQGGFIGVFDAQSGETVALLNDEHYLSDIRTAAAGALAARVLAPANVTTAAVLGSGTQAYWQSRALYLEKPFKKLLIWSRNIEGAERLKARLENELSQVQICVSTDLETTVRTADVLITATLSKEPFVRGEWLREGQHITAVGADDPTKCELESSALKRSRVFVDSIETTVANGDVARAIAAGGYAREHLAGELGDVLASRRPGRESDRDVTIAKLVGIGAQDLAAAEYVIQRLSA